MSASAVSAVRLCAAGKRYRRRGPWVVRDLDVAVPCGALVALRGKNGSGKSTLLRLLAGASLPTCGRRVAAAGLAVGYAPERLAPPPFRADAWLRHHARLRRLPAAEGGRRFAGLAERLGLGGLLDERMPALSKGSLQKVVLVQALLGAPQLLVLDEPFGGLDADAQESLRELLAERAAAGAAVVFSDHGEGGERLASDATWELAEGCVWEARS